MPQAQRVAGGSYREEIRMETSDSTLKTTPVKPKGAAAKARSAKEAGQRLKQAQRASALLKHVSDPTCLQVTSDPRRRRTSRRRTLRAARPEPARRQPPSRAAAARRRHRAPSAGQKQFLRPDRDRGRPGQRRQAVDLNEASGRSHALRDRYLTGRISREEGFGRFGFARSAHPTSPRFVLGADTANGTNQAARLAAMTGRDLLVGEQIGE